MKVRALKEHAYRMENGFAFDLNPDFVRGPHSRKLMKATP